VRPSGCLLIEALGIEFTIFQAAISAPAMRHDSRNFPWQFAAQIWSCL